MDEFKNIDLTQNIESDLDFDECQRKERERAHSEIVNGYVAYQLNALKSKECYKRVFIIMCIMWFLAPLLFMVVIYRSIYYGYISSQSYTAVAGIVASMVSFVSGIIVLPKTIAEYCFNKSEDSLVLNWFMNENLKNNKQ